MQLTIVQCYRSRLKTRGYTDIHITKIDDDIYFVECLLSGVAVSAVVTLQNLLDGLATVPTRPE